MEAHGMSLDTAIARLVADDDQLAVLAEVAAGSSADCVRRLDDIDFLRLVAQRGGADPAGLDGEKARTLHAQLSKIHDYVTSIRQRKEKAALTASRKQVIKKTCEKETAQFLTADQLLDDSPEALERGVLTAEKALLERREQLHQQCANLERFMDEVQARLSSWQEQANVRMVNADNHEQELQETIADLLCPDRAWIAEDTLELRFGGTVLKLQLRLDRGREGLEIVSCETSGLPDDLDNLKEMSLRWSSLSSLVVQLGLRRRQEARMRAAVKELQAEFPLDWHPEERSLQLLARSRAGQSVVCRLRPVDDSRFELTAVTGLDVDSATACSAFQPSDDASLRGLVEELVRFCAAH